jgi:hypothetical protein
LMSFIERAARVKKSVPRSQGSGDTDFPMTSGSSPNGGFKGEQSRSDDERNVGSDCESRRRDGR